MPAAPDSAPAPAPGTAFLIGVDENGLGARLGPLVVTGVMARVSHRGRAWLGRPFGARLRRDLGDSKRLVGFRHCALGEAWARALFPRARTPEELVAQACLESQTELHSRCVKAAVPQCWTTEREHFEAAPDVVARVARHVCTLERQGVHVQRALCSVTCVEHLNHQRSEGGNRFTSDLHAMERLVLALHREAGASVHAVCGKVGGMVDYPRYWGPLSGRLHAVLHQDREESAYYFPGLGELRFVENADSQHPLVMLSSLLGKYVRELLMARIRFYTALGDAPQASGYHDPVTARLVQLSAPHRKRLGVPDGCFERTSNA